MTVIHVEPDVLRNLIQQVVADTVVAVESDRSKLDNEKLAFTEPEAARLLSLNHHQLRDERRRGRIGASTGPGGKILYRKSDLLDYLAKRRWHQE